MRAWARWVTILLGLGPSPAAAYSLNPLPQHEAMTMLAEACLAETEDGPIRCDRVVALREQWRDQRRKLRRGLRQRRHEARAGSGSARWELRDQVGSRRFSALARYSRWPDNPERLWLVPGLAYQIKGRCPRVRGRSGVRAPLPGEARLTCASHYLDLQFLHAMASVPRAADGRPVPVGSGQPTESMEQSQSKLQGWLAFTFEVATGGLQPDAEICAAARAVAPTSGLDAALRDGVGCGQSLDELFLRRRKRGRARGSVRQVAAGALLHAIQDGYSQSHVQRQEMAPNAFEPVVRCEPAVAHYEYTDGHLQDMHAKADSWPRYEACDDGRVADVVTAGALALHWVELKDREGFDRFVQTRFLGG